MQEKAKHSKIPPRVSRTGTLGGGCLESRFQQLIYVLQNKLRLGEIIKSRSIVSTIGFVYNVITSSGT